MLIHISILGFIIANKVIRSPKTSLKSILSSSFIQLQYSQVKYCGIIFIKSLTAFAANIIYIILEKTDNTDSPASLRISDPNLITTQEVLNTAKKTIEPPA